LTRDGGKSYRVIEDYDKKILGVAGSPDLKKTFIFFDNKEAKTVEVFRLEIDEFAIAKSEKIPNLPEYRTGSDKDSLSVIYYTIGQEELIIVGGG